MYCASTINVVYAHFLLVYCLLNFELKKNIVVLNSVPLQAKQHYIIIDHDHPRYLLLLSSPK